MDGGDHATDAAPIKPVSSLRSHFEGLNLRKSSHDEGTPSKEPSKALKSTEASEVGPRVGFTRASFDVARPVSPYGGLKEPGTHIPHTSDTSGRRDESPPKFSQKRPSSMLIQSSPQLTPAVLVESPKSPPKGYFFNRSGSRSPERAVDNTPFAKVRELISQHSSRNSTRSGTPQIGTADRASTENANDGKILDLAAPENAPKPTAQPPPVNRAEKPKIPAKPTTFTVQDIATTTTNPRRPSLDTRVSPFNTPPSSDEETAQESGPAPSHRRMRSQTAQTTIRKVSPQRIPASPVREPQPVRPHDARFMGFSNPAVAPERKDPRMLGFESAAPRPPSREQASSPARANTVSERPLPRDARDFALGQAKVTPRHVSENIRHLPPPVLSPPASASPRQAPVRDARLAGFSSMTAGSSVEPNPGLPPRRTGTEPPPRPPDDSKPPTARSAIQPPHPAPLNRSTKPPMRPSFDPPANMVDPNTHLLPPPKRSATINGPSSPSIQPTKSGAIPSGKITSLENHRAVQRTVIEEDSDDMEEAAPDEQSGTRTEYPDMSQTNRRFPFFPNGLRELAIKSDARAFDTCGQYLCTAGYVTRVFDLSSREQMMSLNHGDTVKATAVAFRPAGDLKDEGSRIWIGNNIGEIHEIDVMTHTTVTSSTSHNRREIVRILRNRKDLWTLDDDGKLFVWPANESGVPSLKYSHLSHRVQKGHTFSMVVQDRLWLATGKEVRIYQPGNEATFAALTSPQSQPGTGEITSGTNSTHQGRIYFGHNDGKVTIYSIKDLTCIGVFKASDYKINSLAFVGDWLWAAYKTGKIYVYDTSSTPWKVKKDWRAHDSPIAGMLLDPSSVWTLQKLQVVSVGHDNVVKLWDGMLEDDWLENAMHERDIEYCTFREIRATVMTWNVGAISPLDLRGDFIADVIHADDPPELLVFGFQEVVDLEDRAVTAKSILGFGKKKDNVKTEQYQSRIYREWRDFLNKCINRLTSSRYVYSEIQTSSLVGLFQCIFVRQEERPHISNLCATDVKCGLKGHYGNKGALITRFVLDDSSMCFINCHLAAGQTHTSQRNNDIASILEAESLPPEPSSDARSCLFVGGGDGSQILDHEICLLNGDLNYRIDAIPRDTVINMVKRNELSKLLERDQIMVSRRRVSGFRLSPFTELPINFAPTYKYDVGTDNYDSSEKKRSPAWCDRLLYRGPGRIKQTEYRRHEVRVSDHRPVSGTFKIRIKTIDAAKREMAKDRCYKAFGEVKRRLAAEASVEYLVNSLGLREKEARALIAQG